MRVRNRTRIRASARRNGVRALPASRHAALPAWCGTGCAPCGRPVCPI